MPVALITGISGQDGSYLSELLLAKGYRVHGVVRSARPSDMPQALVESVELHEVDIASPERVSQVVQEVAPDLIFNLAAMSSVYRSWIDPVLTAEVNAVPVAQLLESAWQLQERSSKAVRFAQASSAEIFGKARQSPQTEETPVDPSSPYGAAKAYAHHLVGVYRQRGMFASSCIFYNHESPRRPETFVTRKITAGVARIACGLQDRLELGSLDSRRDWGWAPDFANALYLTLNADEPDDFIVATGESHSVAEFVEIAFARAGIDDWRSRVTTNAEFSRPVDPADQVGDATRARTQLGWTPTMGFRKIVEAMVDEDLRLLRGP